MSRTLSSAAVATMWLLANMLALATAGYFVRLVPLLPAQVLVLARHPTWLRLHIACAAVALVAGPFQFVSSLRASRPAVHRATGYLYLTAILLGGSAGLLLSPDTAQFVVDQLSDRRNFELVGLDPTPLGLVASATYRTSQFGLVIVSFAMLSIAWMVTAGVALLRARQRRFADHRAWMMRSYSITFAAVTVRLATLPLLVVTQNPVVALTLAFWSWLLNLVVAEWLVRRAPVRGTLLEPRFAR